MSHGSTSAASAERVEIVRLTSQRRKDLVQKFSALAGLVVLIAVFGVTANAFFTVNNGITVALQTTSIVYLGIGETLVIITGGIDLSVGSVLALSGTSAALLVKAGWPVPPAMIAGVLVGMMCGLVNGFVVTRMKLAPFIATLGMTLIARGVALQLTGAAAVSRLGEAFGVLGNGSFFRTLEKGPNGLPHVVFPGIPYPVVILVLIAIAFAFVLSQLPIGRHIYAVGSNEEAARLSGINVARTKMFAYSVSGLLAGLTGIVLMSRLVTGQPNEGIMYELDAIAASVIGGASLMGGVGTISGTLIGAFVIGILRNGLNMNGVSSFIQQIIIGCVVIGTVYIDYLRNRR